jgi:hypothetical protein
MQIMIRTTVMSMPTNDESKSHLISCLCFQNITAGFLSRFSESRLIGEYGESKAFYLRITIFLTQPCASILSYCCGPQDFGEHLRLSLDISFGLLFLHYLCQLSARLFNASQTVDRLSGTIRAETMFVTPSQ